MTSATSEAAERLAGSIVALRNRAAGEPTILFISALSIWVLGWSLGFASSVEVLFSPEKVAPTANPWAGTWADLQRDVVALSWVLIFMIGGFWIARIRPEQSGLGFPRTRAQYGWVIASAIIAAAFGAALEKLCEGLAGPYGWNVNDYAGAQFASDELLPSFLHAVIYGPAEEPALIPGIILLLTATGKVRPGVAITAAVLARVSFHLYYGWGAILPFALWALALIWLWRISGSVWGLVLGHGVHNALSFLQIAGQYEQAVSNVNATLLLLGTLLLIWILVTGQYPRIAIEDNKRAISEIFRYDDVHEHSHATAPKPRSWPTTQRPSPDSDAPHSGGSGS